MKESTRWNRERDKEPKKAESSKAEGGPPFPMPPIPTPPPESPPEVSAGDNAPTINPVESPTGPPAELVSSHGHAMQQAAAPSSEPSSQPSRSEPEIRSELSPQPEPSPQSIPQPRHLELEVVEARGVPTGHKLVATQLEGDEALQTLIDKKKRGDRVYMVVGDANSGKSAFSWRIKDLITGERHRKFQRFDDRTRSGYVNFVNIPGFPLIFDLAGEDFNKFGTAAGYGEKAGLLENFVWPALRVIDGLILIIDFPTIWVRYNEAMIDQDPRRVEYARAAEKKEGELSDAFQRLIQLATLSRDWHRLAKKSPDEFPGDGTKLPTHQEVKDKAQYAGKLGIPVFMALSKADAYMGEQWRDRGFLAPSTTDDGVPVNPLKHWPRAVVRKRMEHFHKFLSGRVRHHTFGFVQSFDAEGVIRSEEIDEQTEKQMDSLLGALDVIAFLDGYPWTLGPPLLGTRILHWLHEQLTPLIGPSGDPWS